jgi:formamidopyrimidine-DNA glycosylase
VLSAERLLKEQGMPELPEVETIRRYLEPRLTGRRIAGVTIRHTGLRWPVSRTLPKELTGQTIRAVQRRAKYLLLRCDRGTLILHLGMTGRLTVIPSATSIVKHDHLDLLLDNHECLRFNDARRFGTVLWTSQDPGRHPLLAGLGLEPLAADFTGTYLHQRALGRTVAVKNFIMNQSIVVGVGNIYANEALFQAGIRPARTAGSISLKRHQRLAAAIRRMATRAGSRYNSWCTAVPVNPARCAVAPSSRPESASGPPIFAGNASGDAVTPQLTQRRQARRGKPWLNPESPCQQLRANFHQFPGSLLPQQ